MSEVIIDPETLRERAMKQNEGIPIEHSQLSLDKYLDRLSVNEREGLEKLIKGIWHITDEYFRRNNTLFAIFGIWTTTYDDEYWDDVKKIAEKDPSKKKYLDRKGQDIDLLFCPELCRKTDRLTEDFRVEYVNRYGNKQFNKLLCHIDDSNLPSHEQIFFQRKSIKKKIDEEKMQSLNDDEKYIWKECYNFMTIISGLCIERKWKHTPWTDHSEYGTRYFNVPEEFVEKEGQTIIRVKGEQYGPINMKIKIPGCRTFHIYLDDTRCAAHRIEYERQINIPFTIIYRPKIGQNLWNSIAIKNGTYVPQEDISDVSRDYKAWKPGDDLPF